MALKDDIENITEYFNSKQNLIKHNFKLLDIYEGNLKHYVAEALRQELSPQSFEQAQSRISPINILKRIIDKLSKIYQQNPIRMIADGTEQDKQLLAWYEWVFCIDERMNISNEFFNMYKYSLIHPFIHQGLPKLRVIPNDRFLVWSNDKVDPTNPTHYIVFDGVRKKNDRTVVDLQIWTDTEFLLIDTDGEIRKDEMFALENPEGINPIGKAPFIYINRSQIDIIPTPDSDTLSMTVLIPQLISDLNYAHKFNSYSILYGVDVDDQNLTRAPNAVWLFKSDPTTEKKPEIGVIKPQVDITESIGMIQAELAFWLQSRGIRPGSVGTLTTENMASGISKMVDEMDTSEERMKQVDIYQKAENSLWDLVIQNMHPYWVKNKLISGNNAMFSPNAEVLVKFPDQVPMLRRSELLDEVIKEIDAGLTTVERGIRRLNPEMSEEDVNVLVGEINQADDFTQAFNQTTQASE